MRHTKPLPIKANTAYQEAEKAGRHVQVMSPMTDTTAMIRRRRGEEGEEAEDMDHEDLQLPALEDGRVVEDRIVGQELVPAATPAVLNDAEALTGERGLVQAERPRPEDIPVPASPFQTPGMPSTVLRRLEQGRGQAEVVTPMAYPKGRPRSLFPLFTDEQLSSMERSQQEAAHLYGQKSLTEPRPSHMPSHEEIMRAYAQKRDEEQGILWKMLQDARMENEVLRQRNEVLAAEIRSYEKLVADLQFRTPLGSRDGGSEMGTRRTPEIEQKNTVLVDGEEAVKTGTDERIADEKEVPKAKSSSPEDPTQVTMQVMLSLMQSMQEMQKRLLDAKTEPKEEDREDVEWVRGGNISLTRLPEWSATTAPIDFADWINILEPQMSDLTRTSSEWWSRLLTESRSWYDEHLRLPPLQRMGHDPRPSKDLDLQKWNRLEKRASTMLLAAIPDAQREELVSSRRLSAMAILCSLLVAYQPGGLAEKELILRSLELPPEATSLADALTGLRRWTRWRRRAMDMGVSEPDPFLLLKGLNRIVKKPLEAHRELNFRISLARSTLQVDATPTSASITQFALHLQAEVEQVAHLEGGRRKESAPEKVFKDDLKVKGAKVKGLVTEDTRGASNVDGRPSEQNAGESSSPPRCRFFLTDQGCRKGRECRFDHNQKDEKRRCYGCGSIEHLASACPRKGPGDGAKAKTMKDEQETPLPSKQNPEVDMPGDANAVKELLKEANKMLKSLTREEGGSKPESGGDQRSEVLQGLQKQIDELKQKTMKLSRMSTEGALGLLDSGATHPLRGMVEADADQHMREVMVTLASGEKTKLKMNAAGTMLSRDPDVEPIVPMGILVDDLGCKVEWGHDGVRVIHPTRGSLPVDARTTGCPQVTRELALQLISEWEDRPRMRSARWDDLNEKDEMVGWMKDLLLAHPVLRRLPEHIQRRLVVEPNGWGAIPGNSRSRKRLRRTGITLHLYAGPEKGFTLSRAMRQVAGSEACEELLEIDIQRGDSHDMMSDHGVYSSLLQAALEGKVNAVIAGPNCRTRSMLRHRPLPSGRPRPVRAWDGEEFGLKDLDAQERADVEEDDTLLWRAIFIFLVARYVRQAKGENTNLPKMTLEQPASPCDFLPEVVSFWETSEWKDLVKEFGFSELTFNQGEYGGMVSKPTTFGGDLRLQLPAPRPMGRYQLQGQHRDSKELARWSPGTMSMIARAIQEEIRGGSPKMLALSWTEHLRYNHTPYRRDCRVCQETLQKQRPHKRIENPWAGVLSLDTAGPFKVGRDFQGKGKFLLIGAYTWLVPKGDTLQKEPDVGEAAEGAPVLEGEGPEEEPEVFEDGEVSSDEGARAEVPEDENPGDDLEIRVFRLVLPMPSKSAKEIVRAASEMVMRLRADGFHLTRIHSDRGKEFRGKFQAWAESRGILTTRTAGDDPRANGRAEVAVQAVKTMLRKALHEAQTEAEYWPMAARYINEVLRYSRRGDKIDFPPFMKPVIARKRAWKREELETFSEEVWYLAPAWADHGHWIMRSDGSVGITRYTLMPAPRAQVDEVWLALEDDGRGGDPMTIRRRIRGKRAVRELHLEEADDLGSDEERAQEKARIYKLVEDEIRHVYEDDWDVAEATLNTVTKIRKMAEGIQTTGDEVLQTRIVGTKEVVRDWDLWIPSVNSEFNSLINDKLALQRLDKEQYKALKKRALEEGKSIEELPSKMVWVIMPDASAPTTGKRKSRWVICGNFEPEKEGQETYSGGADSTAFRVMVKKAAEMNWEGATIDVKTAFLNASLEDDDQEWIVIRPPHILVAQKYLDKDDVFLALKAVYGLRRSPRLWGKTRDKGLREMTLEVEGKVYRLQPLLSEPNLWRVVEDQSLLEDDASRIEGLIMTYVDDLFIAAVLKLVNAVIDGIRQLWATTQPEFVSRIPVKFLGMEVSRVHDGTEVIWKVTQQSYLTDLLQKHPEVRHRKIPITRDQGFEIEEEEEKEAITVEAIRRAQKVVGELLWAVTRSRPDAMFAVAKMGSGTLRCPGKVCEVGDQVKGYLKETWADGLMFPANCGENDLLEVFTDASFGDQSYGCVMVLLHGSPVLWKCGRQSTSSLSTAESELQEIIDGMTAGESTYSVACEVFGEMKRILWTDSQSAMSIMSSEGGSWRTRHLRLKSAHARARL